MSPLSFRRWSLITFPGMVAAILLTTSAAVAVAPSLVKDINQTVDPAPMDPYGLTNVNGVLFLSAKDEEHGREIWKSDGTPSGTVMVKDINPGAFDSNPAFFTDVNGTVFFVADDGVHGSELWKTDGTAAGTVLVKDIRPQSDTYIGSDPSYLVNVNGTLFFTADDGVSGREIWKSNGTDAGTVLVKDVYPGLTTSGATNLVALNGALLFYARDDAHQLELWKSDGTAGGTGLLKTILPSGGGPENLVRVGNRVFFGVHSGTGISDLWKSDGTSAGTVIVKNFSRGPFEPGPSHLTDVNGILYFSSSSGTIGTELWKSDGTAAGTVLVKDINPAAGGSGFPENLTNVSGTLYFCADDGASGYDLWKSDGTAGGTVLIKDINPGASGSVYPSLGFSTFPNVGGAVLFLATDGSHGHELWRTDGTSAGTFMVVDLYPGNLDSLPGYAAFPLFEVMGGSAYFAAHDGTEGFSALWKTNGTAVTTVRVKETPTGTGDSSPAGLVLLNDSVLFAANDGVFGNELWKSDGTSAGTVLVKDIRAGSTGSSPAGFTKVNGTVYFGADVGLGVELWQSDGTTGGTMLVK